MTPDEMAQGGRPIELAAAMGSVRVATPAETAGTYANRLKEVIDPGVCGWILTDVHREGLRWDLFTVHFCIDDDRRKITIHHRLDGPDAAVTDWVEEFEDCPVVAIADPGDLLVPGGHRASHRLSLRGPADGSLVFEWRSDALTDSFRDTVRMAVARALGLFGGWRR